MIRFYNLSPKSKSRTSKTLLILLTSLKTLHFHTSLSSGKDLLVTCFQCGLYPSEKSTTLSISLVYSTPLSNSWHEMSSEKIVFLDTEVFKGPRFTDNKTLDVQVILSLQKLFNIRPSLRVTLSVLKRVLSKERPCVY